MVVGCLIIYESLHRKSLFFRNQNYQINNLLISIKKDGSLAKQLHGTISGDWLAESARLLRQRSGAGGDGRRPHQAAQEAADVAGLAFGHDGQH